MIKIRLNVLFILPLGCDTWVVAIIQRCVSYRLTMASFDFASILILSQNLNFVDDAQPYIPTYISIHLSKRG